jgi:RES domain-containing protein
MPLVAWRITTKRDRSGAFDGEGARLYGGRWNRPGTRLVYAAEHLSLAALELFVHLDPEDQPRSLYRFRFELPDDAVEVLPRERLPRTWRDYPAPAATTALGSQWASRAERLALLVPSAIIPEENNVLVNPAHARFGELRIGAAERFSVDPRLWKNPGRKR